jgi:hypothetical protein
MRIEIEAIKNRDQYRVWADGKVIIRKTTTPLCSAARALMAQGVDPNTMLEKVRRGSDRVDMRARVGDAAKLTVREPADGDAPFFTKYTEPPADVKMKRSVAA